MNENEFQTEFLDYSPPAPAGDAGEGVCRGWAGSESPPTVPMTSSPALPTPGTQLAGVETAETQGHRERQREAADRSTAPPVREGLI